MARRRWAAALVVGALAALGVPATRADAVLVNVAPGGGPHVRVFNGSGGLQSEWAAYASGFGGGVNVAIGDVDGDGQPEVVTGAGPGGSPHVRIFNLNGGVEHEWLAYASGFHGGVEVAVGDVDNDGLADIITGAGAGGGPHVRVFNYAGVVRWEWAAYNPGFAGGVHVAAGNVDGDPDAEVVTGPGPTGGPHVRVFTGQGAVQNEWMAYNPGFPGGVNVAAGEGKVVTAPAGRGGPHVRTFSGSGNPGSEWMAYDPAFTGGVRVAIGQLGGSAAIATGAGQGGGPHVRVFNTSGNEQTGFMAYAPAYTGGANVAIGGDRLVTGAGVVKVIEVFRAGDQGPGVASLQQRLLNAGYWLPAADGVFGSTTTQAVYAFQKANGLPRDGDIGPEDQAALDSGARAAPVSTSGDLVEVDKARQLLFVIRSGRMVWTFNTSTGSNGSYTSGGVTYRAITPEGHFTFLRQVDGVRTSHLGQLFRPKYFTNAGHAIHGSPSIPPYPASHGCVRLSNPAINFIWDAGLAPLGSPIWVHS
jgi:hypothetical protein